MLFIIIHHLILNGVGFTNVSSANLSLNIENIVYSIGGFLEPFFIIGVNLFFILSGYFQIRFSWKKCLVITLTMYVYMFFIQLFGLFTGFNTLNTELIRRFILSFESYWFLEVYIIIMLLSPLLNLIIEHSDKRMGKYFFLICLVFFSAYAFLIDSKYLGVNRGYSLVFACCMYLTGAFIKRGYILERLNSAKKSFLSYVIFSGLNALIIVLSIALIRTGRIAGVMLSYNNPLVVLASVSFFCVFTKLNFNENSKFSIFVRFVSKNVLGVYIIHSSNKVFVHYRNIPLQYLAETGNFVLAFLAVVPYALGIFIACILIDKGFQKTFGVLINKLSTVLGNYFDKMQMYVCEKL